MDQWLAKINRLANWQVAIIIAVVGFVVFATGLHGPFMHDDIGQIVYNPLIHSIRNIKLFFTGSTFYTGNGITPLNGGVYYRPLMTTVFSLLYMLFGLHPVAFHLFQLVVCISVVILLYLLLRSWFKPVLALTLSLVFLVHPINSQNVFAIPSLQDPLFMCFGLLALLLLIRFTSVRSLAGVAVCLFFSLLSKELGLYFVIIAAIYLLCFNRKRILPFVGIVALPVILWFALRIHAVGLFGSIHAPPIDRLSFVGRLLTMPSILLFYIIKLVFPLKLATGYYWVYPQFSLRHVLLPLVIDLAVMAAVTYVTFLIRKRVAVPMFNTYLFFAAWLVLGLLPYLQVLPLDFTVSETWFYFPFIGVLGMVAVILDAFRASIKPHWFLIVAMVVIIILGFRTALRGFDWRDKYTLAQLDITVSKEDYYADEIIANHLANAGQYSKAKTYAEIAVNNFPVPEGYNTLGVILMNLGDYSAAAQALTNALQYGDWVPVYENLSRLSLVYGAPGPNEHLLLRATNKFPNDPALWVYLAVFAEKNNDNAQAKSAITNAVHFGAQVPDSIYYGIMNHQPFTIEEFGNKSMYIQ